MEERQDVWIWFAPGDVPLWDWNWWPRAERWPSGWGAI